FGSILREQYSGAGVLLNDRGSIDSFTAGQRFPAVYRTFNRFSVENHRPPSRQVGTLASRWFGQRVQCRGSHSGQVCVHDLQRERFHFGGNPSQFAEICLIQGPVVRTDKIVAWFSHEHSTGGKLSGKVRNHHQRDVKGSCNLSHVKGTGAAESDHDEVARIVPTFDGHLTHR